MKKIFILFVILGLAACSPEISSGDYPPYTLTAGIQFYVPATRPAFYNISDMTASSSFYFDHPIIMIPDFKKETTTNITLGIKNYFDKDVQINLSLANKEEICQEKISNCQIINLPILEPEESGIWLKIPANYQKKITIKRQQSIEQTFEITLPLDYDFSQTEYVILPIKMTLENGENEKPIAYKYNIENATCATTVPGFNDEPPSCSTQRSSVLRSYKPQIADYLLLRVWPKRYSN